MLLSGIGFEPFSDSYTRIISTPWYASEVKLIVLACMGGQKMPMGLKLKPIAIF